MDPVRTLDFCRVIGRKKLKGSGLELGETVCVVSLKPAPEKKSDPYLQRLYAVVLKVTSEGDVLIPKEDNDFKAVLMDPRNLEKLSDEEVKPIQEKLAEKYKVNE